MHAPQQMDWWPEKQLLRHPVTEVFVCGHAVQPPLYSHVVNFPRLEIPLNGCYENHIDIGGQSTTVRLRPGAALFAPNNCWNLPSWRLNVKLMCLLFGHQQLGISIVSASGGNSRQMLVHKFSMPRPVTGPLPHILQAMLELAGNRKSGETFTALTRAMIQCVKVMILESAGQQSIGRSRALLERVCTHLQGHYQQDVSRETMARHFGVSPNHLSRVFQTQGHMTFSSYLTHVRIDRAKHLLCNYNFKLDDIAARCGFSDTPYFCRVFKRLTKCTPAAYRQRVRATS